MSIFVGRQLLAFLIFKICTLSPAQFVTLNAEGLYYNQSKSMQKFCYIFVPVEDMSD